MKTYQTQTDNENKNELHESNNNDVSMEIHQLSLNNLSTGFEHEFLDR